MAGGTKLTVNGSRVSPNVVGTDGVTIVNAKREYQFVVGVSPAFLSTPQIQRGVNEGQELILQGTDDTNLVPLKNGNGLTLNGPCDLKAGSLIYLLWDGDVWSEVGRNDNSRFTFQLPHDVASESDFTVNGSKLDPNVITAADGISILDVERELQFIIGDGPTTVTAEPQIEPGTTVGQELILQGMSDLEFVTLHDGDGLNLNGDIEIGEDATLYFVWDGTVWNEVTRNDT